MRRHLGVSGLFTDVHDGLHVGGDGLDKLSKGGRGGFRLLGDSSDSQEVSLGIEGLLESLGLLANGGIELLGGSDKGVNVGLDESIKLGDPLGQVGIGCSRRSGGSGSSGSSRGSGGRINASLGRCSVLGTSLVNMRLLSGGQVFKTRRGGFETGLVGDLEGSFRVN